MKPSDILDVAEMLKILKISRPTLYKLIREKKIKAKKVGRSYRFIKSDLESYFKSEDEGGKE